MIETAAQVTVNDPTAAAANASAIVNAFSQASRVWLPDGQTVYTQPFALPSSAKKLFGAASLIAAGPTFGGGLVTFSGTTGLVLEDFSTTVDKTAYPNTAGLLANGAAGTEIRGVTSRAPVRIDGGNRSEERA